MVKRTYYNMHTNQTLDYVKSKVNWFKAKIKQSIN